MEPDRLVISADVEHVSTARRFVRRALVDAPADISDDLQLAVSELVTNAIEHGHGQEVEVVTDRRPDGFAVSVTSADAKAEIGPDEEWEVADAPERTGRGLGIVRELADRVEVRRRGELLTITVVRARTAGSSVHA